MNRIVRGNRVDSGRGNGGLIAASGRRKQRGAVRGGRAAQAPLAAAAAAVLALAVTFVARLAQAQGTAPPPASSDPPPVGGAVGYFGEHGQIAISGDLKFNVLHESRSMNGGSATSYELEPALDYFVSTNVSIGGLIDLRREYPFGDNQSSLTSFAIGPRVGYNVVLASAASLWVRLGLAYEHQTFSSAGTDTSGYTIPISIYAPVLWHPVSHLFLGAGPFLSTDLIAKESGRDTGKTTDIGLSSTIGGYFGGL